MPSYIDLIGANGKPERHDLPDLVTGEAGEAFRLRYVVQGGGNAIVFRASPEGPLRKEIDECAIKFLRRRDGARYDRFVNEIRIMEQLDHARIAQIFDHGELAIDGNAVPWIAMELGGYNLRRHVHESGVLPADQLIASAIQMTEALQHVHDQGIIHRDLKPDNFVWDGEESGSLLMIDFGIAKRLNEDVSARPLDQFTQHLEFVGPVFFSSPELIAYSRDKACPVDHRSDLFQFGKTLWFLATGQISAGVPSARVCPYGGRLHSLVLEMLNDDPDDRPNSAAEIGRRLADCL